MWLLSLLANRIDWVINFPLFFVISAVLIVFSIAGITAGFEINTIKHATNNFLFAKLINHMVEVFLSGLTGFYHQKNAFNITR